MRSPGRAGRRSMRSRPPPAKRRHPGGRESSSPSGPRCAKRADKHCQARLGADRAVVVAGQPRPWQAVSMASSLAFDPIEEAGRQWRKHWGPGAAVPMMAVTSVMRVQHIWLARLNETLTPFELTFARYEALMLLYLSRAGALPLGKIGMRLQVHPTSVTNLIDGLEKAGYVRRTPHPNDRRTTLA